MAKVVAGITMSVDGSLRGRTIALARGLARAESGFTHWVFGGDGRMTTSRMARRPERTPRGWQRP